MTALRVLDRHRDRFHVSALTAFANAGRLAEQAACHEAARVGLVGEVGVGCLVDAATRPDVDIVINSIVGAAGLDATIAALECGKRVALANKESLVMGGALVADAVKRGGGEIVPVDSEHSAILQCIAGRPRTEVRRLVLTASGGPFRTWSAERLAQATLAEALEHPTWRMGRKITVDSATLANKALEVIEAHFLFGIPYENIDVVVHPQSIVHSFVEFVDGSVLAQLGAPSMELPILYALTYPDRAKDAGIPPFNPVALSPLTFEPVRHADFVCLGLGIEAGRAGGVGPIVFNAANEQAVGLFLDGLIRFADIPRAIDSALAHLGTGMASSRDEVLAADSSARRHVKELFRC